MDIRPQITVRNKKTGDKKVYRLDQERATIGRDASNYIVIEGRAISRTHAEVLQEGNQNFVRDLKSNNGTLVNEKSIPTQEKALLRSGDIIQIEEYDLLFQILTGKEAEDLYEITDTDLLEVKMVKKLLKAMDRENAPSLEVLEGPQAGLRFVLEAKSQDVVIGRDPACEFVIDSEVISRKHARIEKRFDTVILHDLHSKNGAFVNRERITEKRLQDGDIIHMGTLSLSFRNPQELMLDFGPPQVSVEQALPVDEAAPVGTESVADPEQVSSSGMRSSRRREGAAPAPPVKEEVGAFEEAPFEESSPSEAAPRSTALATARDGSQDAGPAGFKLPGGFRLSPPEIIAIVVGLIVLIGSIWGILKLL